MMPTAALTRRASAAPRGKGVTASASGSSNPWRARRHQPWRAPHGPVRRSNGQTDQQDGGEYDEGPVRRSRGQTDVVEAD